MIDKVHILEMCIRDRLYYDSFDLACIIHSLDMGTKTASIMLEKIWKEDNQYLSPYYRCV